MITCMCECHDFETNKIPAHFQLKKAQQVQLSPTVFSLVGRSSCNTRLVRGLAIIYMVYIQNNLFSFRSSKWNQGILFSLFLFGFVT